MIRRLGLDPALVLVTLLIATYGVLVLYSAGQTDAPTDAAGAWSRQLVWFALGTVAAAVVYRTSSRFLEWLAPVVYAGAIALLVLTLVIGTGAGTAASSRSWIAVGGVRLGQPAELAKLATILLLARYLAGLREPPDSLRDLIPPALIAGVPTLLVLAQPDLGSALVFIGILFVMLFWSGVRPLLLLLLLSPALSLLLAGNTALWGAWMVFLLAVLILGRVFVGEGVAVYLVNSAMGVLAITLWNRLQPHQRARLTTFLNPELDPARAGYQAIQSKVAVGSGGWVGHGLTLGPQKRLAFLPEQHTDFIFSVVGEELGFLGVLVALGLFLALLLILVRIARRALDPFAGLLVAGVLGLFFTHIFENVGMTVNVTPITGIPLPLFSYGGSFVLVSMIGIGAALRVARDSRQAGYFDI